MISNAYIEKDDHASIFIKKITPIHSPYPNWGKTVHFLFFIYHSYSHNRWSTKFTINRHTKKPMISNVLWKKMTRHLFSSKTNYTNTFSIPHLREKCLFHIFNYPSYSHNRWSTNFYSDRKQRTINDQQCVYRKDEHAFIFIQNKLHQYILHTQIEWK